MSERLTDEQLDTYERHCRMEPVGGISSTVALMIIADLRYHKQLAEERGKALEEIEAEIDQWRDPAHAMACVKVIVTKVLGEP